MPSLKLTTLVSYRTYFNNIATQHVGIDGFKWGSKDVLANDNRSDMPAKFLWALPYEIARYGDNGSDNVIKYKLARVSYLEVRNSELFADEDEQYDACEEVIEEILARVYRDKRGYDDAGVWKMVATQFASWRISPVVHTFGSTVYVGWELQLEFMDNTNLAFNTEKWSDTLTPP